MPSLEESEGSPASSPGGAPEPSHRQRNGTSKRKRAPTTTTGESSSHRRRTITRDEEDEEGEEEDDQDDNRSRHHTAASSSEDEDSGNEVAAAAADDVYDPDQDPDERRKVQAGYRELLKNVTDHQDEILNGSSKGLYRSLKKSNKMSNQLKQTAEATIDSRFLVTATEIAGKKTSRLVKGDFSQGLDPEEFVSKLIRYMREGLGASEDSEEVTGTQRQRRRRARADGGEGDEDDEEEGDEGDMMNWPHLGRFAVLPSIRRPAVPGFLLGPLSVEKKIRKVAQRTARWRPDNIAETRPEVLNIEELAKKENDLTQICGKILQQLVTVQAEAQEKVADELGEEMTDEESTRVMHQHGLRSTGGVDMMRFVVNPKSFGQTIENMFYTSFLIRDGRVAVELDENGLPALAPVDKEAEDYDADEEKSLTKHQAILSMDMQTWQEIIDTFELEESLIEHRAEGHHSGPGAKGWYS